MSEQSGRVSRALVLGGGGVAGIAWEIGLLAGLAKHGTDLAAGADLVVGTSAGATVGALICGDSGSEALLASQHTPVSDSKDRMPQIDLDCFLEIFALMEGPRPDPGATLRQIGKLALEAPTVSETERREIIAWRLPSHTWPARPLLITAVDAERGERVAFDAASGVPLIDAVAASSAVPGVWPPVTIGDRRYIDGGVYSPANDDLVAGQQRTVVLYPMIRADGAFTHRPGIFPVIADSESVTAFGPNPLDPACRAPACDAGMRQAEGIVQAVEHYWHEGAS
jgi:NTE family protein